ncbi:Signal transduction histidine kinase [Catalinimonas alkaloidigena]|uniref:histidine kinase n=1 Tax=Catalinimonas alkaloidigena TaxID=1075417 RepID=A0A1G8WYN7_9BACT|nr:substrate-binding domain-containing protein [Catalinimonas alkaloidigena]SDJ83331.1 Signal transduction histidine kinase [Catalinimonas alkaloidigena]
MKPTLLRPTLFVRACALLLGLWLVGGVASCRNPNRSTYTIGFSQCVDNDDWRQAMLHEMYRELAFHPEVQLIYKNAGASSAQQIQDIRDLEEAGIDLLIVSPNEAAPITPVVEEVFQSGIPVIVIDRKTTSEQYTAYIGADNYEIGNIAGKYVANLLPEGGRILEVTGLPGSTPAQARHRGFVEALRARDASLFVIDTLNGQWERSIARQQAQQQRKRYAKADLIFAHNDMMALGTYEVISQDTALAQAKLLGIDALPGINLGIDLVDQGILDATFLYPTGGDKAIEVALAILDGHPFERENIMQTTVVDASNVKISKLQAEKIADQQQDMERQQTAIESQLSIYRSQRTLLYIVAISLAVALLLGAYALYSLREKQLTNRRLREQNEEILAQRNRIMELARETEEANQAKFQFFTNISHEFRTPLTLVLGSLEDILHENPDVGASMRHDLGMIRKHASRLLRLVSQLLDFRRLEHTKMHVRASQGDLVAFVREVWQAFEKTAHKRDIDYQFVAQPATLALWFDPTMLDKVFFNLLSNAFKFTPDGGRIQVMLQQQEPGEAVQVRVMDTGKGMTAEEVQHVFDPFYQGDPSRSLGTGLGLSLSRELVERHGGRISVRSEWGHGTVFEVQLPGRKDQLPEVELVDQPVESLLLFDRASYQYAEEWVHDAPPEETVEEKQTTTLLVIEDNEDLRNFLVRKLRRTYEVVACADGQEGLQQAYGTVPDLIVSDVMLPGQNGLSIAETLKNDLRTSHIPIILLTARDSVEQQVEGIQTGADAYIVKPFHLPYLLERVKKLLWNRDQLRKRFASAEVASPVPASAAPSLDQKFLADLTRLIQERLAEPELNVNALAREVGLSRVQLYRKVKALLGVGISDYIKTQRLQRAKTLLQQQELTVAEVAYAVGFSSPAYFSTVFKSQFDQSPSEFIKQVTSV